MTTRLRIDQVQLDTTDGLVVHKFDGPLTVLTGPVGVGKTTLFELIKYAFGGGARISPVARDHVRAVTISIGTQHGALRLTRSLADETNFVSVDSSDPRFRGSFRIRRRTAAEPDRTISDVLLEAVGLPTDAKVTTSNRTSRVTFNNLLPFLYIEQREIDRSIAHNTDKFAESARKAVFEILFGITDVKLLELRAAESTIRSEVEVAALKEATVRSFLSESQTRSRLEAEIELSEAQLGRKRGLANLESLRSNSARSRGDVGVVRELVLRTRSELADLQQRQDALKFEQRERRSLQGQLNNRTSGLDRVDSAESILAPIDFVVCPRCVQSIKHRHVPNDACSLCLQPEPIPTESLIRRSADERSRLDSQVEEVRLLIRSGDAELERLSGTLAETRENLRRLDDLLDRRTQEFVSPRLEKYAEASAEVARGDAQISELENLLRQWDLVQDLERANIEAAVRLSTNQAEQKDIVERLSKLKSEVLAQLSAEYLRVIGKIGVPTVTSASINPDTYLPYANNLRFDRLSTGGIATSLICSYWVAMLSTALRDGQTLYPTLLILDTPRKSIGEKNARLVDQLYRELDTLSTAYPDRLQVIIADNDLPKKMSSNWRTVNFDYDHPTVPTVMHPGEANVVTIDSGAADEWQSPDA